MIINKGLLRNAKSVFNDSFFVSFFLGVNWVCMFLA